MALALDRASLSSTPSNRSVSGTQSLSSHNRSSSRLSHSLVNVRVCTLDEAVHTLSINRHALGSHFYAHVVRLFQLPEPEYFDLEFRLPDGRQCWIEPTVGVVSQWKRAMCVRSVPSVASTEPLFFLSVKYFVPDPTQLLDPLTRYLYAQQIKHDLRTGQLICSENTAALLVSYILQAEWGDFTAEMYGVASSAASQIRSTYATLCLSNVPALGSGAGNQAGTSGGTLQSPQFDTLIEKIVAYHKMHAGMTQPEADLCILDTARKIEFYGIRLFPVKDADSMQLYLSIQHSGLALYQWRVRVNSFNWSRIRKFQFQKKKFTIRFKLDTDDQRTAKLDTVDFFFVSKDQSRRFWQLCIDYHSFFRHYAPVRAALAAAIATPIMPLPAGTEGAMKLVFAERQAALRSRGSLKKSKSAVADPNAPAAAAAAGVPSSFAMPMPMTGATNGPAMNAQLPNAQLGISSPYGTGGRRRMFGQPMTVPHVEPSTFAAAHQRHSAALPSDLNVYNQQALGATQMSSTMSQHSMAAPAAAASGLKHSQSVMGSSGGRTNQSSYTSDTIESAARGAQQNSASSGSHSLSPVPTSPNNASFTQLSAADVAAVVQQRASALFSNSANATNSTNNSNRASARNSLVVWQSALPTPPQPVSPGAAMGVANAGNGHLVAPTSPTTPQLDANGGGFQFGTLGRSNRERLTPVPASVPFIQVLSSATGAAQANNRNSITGPQVLAPSTARDVPTPTSSLFNRPASVTSNMALVNGAPGTSNTCPCGQKHDPFQCPHLAQLANNQSAMQSGATSQQTRANFFQFPGALQQQQQLPPQPSMQPALQPQRSPISPTGEPLRAVFVASNAAILSMSPQQPNAQLQQQVAGGDSAYGGTATSIETTRGSQISHASLEPVADSNAQSLQPQLASAAIGAPGARQSQHFFEGVAVHPNDAQYRPPLEKQRSQEQPMISPGSSDARGSYQLASRDVSHSASTQNFASDSQLKSADSRSPVMVRSANDAIRSAGATRPASQLQSTNSSAPAIQSPTQQIGLPLKHRASDLSRASNMSAALQPQQPQQQAAFNMQKLAALSVDPYPAANGSRGENSSNRESGYLNPRQMLNEPGSGSVSNPLSPLSISEIESDSMPPSTAVSLKNAAYNVNRLGGTRVPPASGEASLELTPARLSATNQSVQSSSGSSERSSALLPRQMSPVKARTSVTSPLSVVSGVSGLTAGFGDNLTFRHADGEDGSLSRQSRTAGSAHDSQGTSRQSSIEQQQQQLALSQVSTTSISGFNSAIDSALQALALDLLYSERTFVRDLEIAAKLFAEFLRESANAQVLESIGNLQFLEDILSSLTRIGALHRAILGDLDALVSSSSSSSRQSRSTSSMQAQAGAAPLRQDTLLAVFTRHLKDVSAYRDYLVDLDSLVQHYLSTLLHTPQFEVMLSRFELPKPAAAGAVSSTGTGTGAGTTSAAQTPALPSAANNACYLFLHDFFIKPVIRILDLTQSLQKLMELVPVSRSQTALNPLDNEGQIPENEDEEAEALLEAIDELSARLNQLLRDYNLPITKTLNFLAIIEVRKDVLLNFSPALETTFSDMLVCAKRSYMCHLHFKASRAYWLKDLEVRDPAVVYESQPELLRNLPPHAIQLMVLSTRDEDGEGGGGGGRESGGSPSSDRPGSRTMLLAAHSDVEKERWLEDLSGAIANAHRASASGPDSEPTATPDERTLQMLTAGLSDLSVSIRSSESAFNSSPAAASSNVVGVQSAVTTNSLVCVCYHRTNSLNFIQYTYILENQKSGYLLRKFQNSNGWQRLWCVFSKCSLFFYRSPDDATPIACLPLWGYALNDSTSYANSGGMQAIDSLLATPLTFRLSYKSHTYYFRTLDEYQFERWLGALRNALMNDV